ncbi:MAG: hypothetical protein JWR09_3795 [Mucilaginibacter sp.]|nr:hypothetical protein [Mucilaginibacter sp.]
MNAMDYITYQLEFFADDIKIVKKDLYIKKMFKNPLEILSSFYE